MRVGSFALPEQVGQLAAAGADYVELFGTKTFMLGERDDFDSFRRAASMWPIPPRAFSGLIPAELKLCGPERDKTHQRTYLDELFHRIETLADGEEVRATVGSAGARNVPDGYSRERALDEIAAFLRLAGDKAESAGVTLNLEHLYRGESNVFNTLRSCGEFIRERALDKVHLVADLYHLMMEKEPLSTVTEFSSMITHAHVADSNRDAPGTGDYPITQFLTTLRKSGFVGDCSIEAFWSDFENQVDPAIHTVRSAAIAAGF